MENTNLKSISVSLGKWLIYACDVLNHLKTFNTENCERLIKPDLGSRFKIAETKTQQGKTITIQFVTSKKINIPLLITYRRVAGTKEVIRNGKLSTMQSIYYTIKPESPCLVNLGISDYDTFSAMTLSSLAIHLFLYVIVHDMQCHPINVVQMEHSAISELILHCIKHGKHSTYCFERENSNIGAYTIKVLNPFVRFLYLADIYDSFEKTMDALDSYFLSFIKWRCTKKSKSVLYEELDKILLPKQLPSVIERESLPPVPITVEEKSNLDLGLLSLRDVSYLNSYMQCLLNQNVFINLLKQSKNYQMKIIMLLSSYSTNMEKTIHGLLMIYNDETQFNNIKVQSDPLNFDQQIFMPMLQQNNVDINSIYEYKSLVNVKCNKCETTKKHHKSDNFCFFISPPNNMTNLQLLFDHYHKAHIFHKQCESCKEKVVERKIQFVTFPSVLKIVIDYSNYQGKIQMPKQLKLHSSSLGNETYTFTACCLVDNIYKTTKQYTAQTMHDDKITEHNDKNEKNEVKSINSRNHYPLLIYYTKKE